MRNFIKRIVSRKRGMEALQTVLLLGVAFVVVLGLRAAYTSNETTLKSKIVNIISGNGSGGDAAGGDASGGNASGGNATGGNGGTTTTQ